MLIYRCSLPQQYLDMIHTWGGWQDFQELLRVLTEIANKHGVTPTTVATRWVLQQPAVAAVIVGTRLGVTSHNTDNHKVFGFRLALDDMAVINRVALGQDGEKAARVYDALGDCGNEYRR